MASSMGMDVITFSGFEENNPLRSIGKINYWLNSSSYNIVESTHQIWLLSIVDYIFSLKE